MPAPDDAWRGIRRFIAHTKTSLRTNSSTGWTNIVRWCNDFPGAARSASRQVYQFCERTRQNEQATRRHSQLVWQEAMWEDRRAKRRALVLLVRLLNPEQRREFREFRHFHLTGGSTGERYRIRVDMIANIDVLRDDGAVKYRLCVIPTGSVPVYDVMAAQLLHLQDPATEQRLLQQANVFPIDRKVMFSRSVWI